jgi:hypothetical protein
MATGGLYGNASESVGLYGNTTNFGGSYFEWFIFYQSDTQPATPTGGSWSFVTNTGTPPTGWSATPFSAPTLPVWVSIALVNSRSDAALAWSAPGLFSYQSGLPILSGSGTPAPGDGINSQLYIQTSTTPQTIWFKQSGTWVRLVGSTLYADLTTNQTIAGTKTFSSPIAGSVTGTAANVTGIVDIANGGTSSTTASGARTALSAAYNAITISAGTGLTGGGDLTANRTLAIDSSVVTLTGTQTLTNKTLTSPKINEILDTSGNRILGLSPTASAVDYLTVKNGTGVGVPIHTYADGTSANIGWHIQPKGTGLVTISDGTDFNKGIRFRSSGSAASAITLLDAVATAGRVVTLPDATTTLVGRDTTDTLTNKTIAFASNTFTGALAIANGGTGQITAAAAITALTGTQTSAYYLRSNGTNATLSALSAADLTGTVAIATGGTGQTTANAAFNALAPSQTGNASKYLQTDGTNTSWDAISLSTADITGTLGTANGGTGLTSFTSGGVVYASSTSALATGSAFTFDGSTVKHTQTAGAAYFSSQNTATSSGAMLLGANAGGDLNIYNPNSTAVIFYASGAEKMRISSATGGVGAVGIGYTSLTSVGNNGLAVLGNVGIGTASPAWKLTLSDGTVSGGMIPNSSNFYIGTISNHRIQFRTNDTDRMMIDTSGNLGLGVTPSAWLSSIKAMQISSVASFIGDSATTRLRNNIYTAASTADIYLTTAAATDYAQNAGRHLWFTAPSGTAGTTATMTQAMTLDASGNLLVGTTSSTGVTVAAFKRAGDALIEISANNGTPATDSLAIGQAGTNVAYVYQRANQPLIFGTNNTERARFDASGNLLVGTPTSSGAKLTLQANATTGYSLWSINDATLNYSQFYFGGTASSGYQYIRSDGRSTGWISFGTNDTERVRIDISGNLGLGVTPSAWASNFRALDISGGSGGGAVYSATNVPYAGLGTNYYESTGSKYKVAGQPATNYLQYNGVHSWYTTGSTTGTAGSAISFTQAMTLDASGRLLLGTTSPDGILNISGATTGNSFGRIFNNSGNLYWGVESSTGGTLMAGTAGYSACLYTQATNSLHFGTIGTLRVTIDSSGNLLVGTTSASGTPTQGMQVLINSGASSIQVGHSNGTATGNEYAGFSYNATKIGSITQSGTTAVLFNVTSDQRLKENIVDAPEFGSVIDSIQVRSFDWKTDHTHQRAGFVAQELVTVAPEAVHQPTDTEEMMAVDYSKLVPMLVKEIQSLRQRLSAANL